MNVHIERVNRGRRRAVFGLVLGLLMLGVPGVVLATIPGRGFVEICKTAAGPGVSGTFNFTVAGENVAVPVGACSAPVEVPAGAVTVTEAFQPGLIVEGISVSPGARLVSRDLPGRSVTVAVPEGDTSTQTVVTFANAIEWGQLKVCKVAGAGVPVGTNFVFSVGGPAVNVLAGPAPGGFCTVAGTFLVGTGIAVAEAMPSGVQVTDIAVTPSDRVTGSPNLAAGRVAVAIGNGVTEVVFTNAEVPTPTTTTTTTVPTPTTTTVPTPTTSTTLPGGGILPTSPTTSTTQPGSGVQATTTTAPSAQATTTTQPGGGVQATTTTAPSAQATTTTQPGGGVQATTTTARSGGSTTTTLPVGPTTTARPSATTSTTTPVGGSSPTSLGGPGVGPSPSGGKPSTSVLAFTGSTTWRLLPWAMLVVLAGLLLVMVGRQEPLLGVADGRSSMTLAEPRTGGFNVPMSTRAPEPVPEEDAGSGLEALDELDWVLADLPDLPDDVPDITADMPEPDAHATSTGTVGRARLQTLWSTWRARVRAVSPPRLPVTGARPAPHRRAPSSAPLDLGP